MKFNLKQWKKLKSEKDHTLFKNAEGHELKIYHKNLTHKMKAAMLALPEVDEEKYEKSQDNDRMPKETKADKEEKYAKGGMVKKYADGGEAKADESAAKEALKDAEESAATDEEDDAPEAEAPQPQGPPPAQAAAQPEPAPEPTFAEKAMSFAQNLTGTPPPQPQGPPPATLAATQAPAEDVKLVQHGAPPEPVAAREQPQVEQAPVVPPIEKAVLQDPAQMMQQSYNEAQQGLQKQFQAESAIGKSQADIYKQQIEKDAALQQQVQDAMTKRAQQFDEAFQDYKNAHFDPMQGINRFSSTLGLLIAGFNPTDRPNAVLEQINKDIDRNVEMQKAQMGKSMNMMHAAMEEFGNEKSAADFTRIMMGMSAADKIAQAAAQTTDLQARARLLANSSALKQHYAPQLMNLNLRQAMIDTARKGGDISKIIPMMRMVDPKTAENMEEHSISGVPGLSQVKIPEAARTKLANQQVLINGIKDLRDWVKIHGASLDPNVRAEGEARAAELQQMYRQGVGASSSEEEQKYIEKNIINTSPAQLLARWNVDPKLRAVLDSTEAAHRTLLRQYYPADRADLQNPRDSHLAWAQQNLNNPNPKVRAKAVAVNKFYNKR